MPASSREVEVFEYEDEGQIVKEESVVYTLTQFNYQNAESGLTIASADGVVVFGYSSDMAMSFPNDITVDAPFALMAVNGAPLNCSMPVGEYDISFSITGNGTGMLSFIASEPGSVDEVDVADTREIYYDLNGNVVNNPQKGIYIVRKGAEVKKIIR